MAVGPSLLSPGKKGPGRSLITPYQTLKGGSDVFALLIFPLPSSLGGDGKLTLLPLSSSSSSSSALLSVSIAYIRNIRRIRGLCPAQNSGPASPMWVANYAITGAFNLLYHTVVINSSTGLFSVNRILGLQKSEENIRSYCKHFVPV